LPPKVMNESVCGTVEDFCDTNLWIPEKKQAAQSGLVVKHAACVRKVHISVTRPVLLPSSEDCFIKFLSRHHMNATK